LSDLAVGLGIESQSNHQPVVYYVGVGDRIKIGTTKLFRPRMSGVRAEVWHAVEPGGRELEQARHMQFAAYRLDSEWFEPAEPILALCAVLRQAYLLPLFPPPYSAEAIPGTRRGRPNRKASV
jgi:hypothetical protein